MPLRNKSVFTEKELAFIKFYAGNQTEAARLAGYKDSAHAGLRLMKRKHIRKAIDEKLAAATKESAKHMGKKITFTRNDIIMGLWKVAEEGESDSAKVSALSKLADIFQLSQKSNKDTDMFAGWTDEELQQFRITGVIPERFGGLSAADDHEQPDGLSAGSVSTAPGPKPIAGSSSV